MKRRSVAWAQDEVDLPLDELPLTKISTTAKYDQDMSEVAASVTIISSEEIPALRLDRLRRVAERDPRSLLRVRSLRRPKASQCHSCWRFSIELERTFQIRRPSVATGPWGLRSS